MQTGYRVKKRTFVVAGLALLASLLIAGMLSLYAASLLGPGVIHRFSLEDQPQQIALQGSGINLGMVNPGNLLSDSSFEPISYNHFMTVYSGSQDTLAVSSTEASLDGFYQDDFFVGADARIMTLDTEGYRLKKQTTVKSYILNQPGLFQAIRLPADLPANFRVVDLALGNNNQVLAVGSRGTVLTLENNQVKALSYTDSLNSLVSVATYRDAIVTCSNAGELYYSSDGYSWEIVHGPDISLKKVALSDDGMITAVGRQGKIVSGHYETMQAVDSPTTRDLNAVAAWQDGWLAAGDDGVILYSRSGTIWEPLTVDSDENWLDIEADGDIALIVGETGNVAAVAINNDKPIVVLYQDSITDSFISVLKVKNEQYLAVDNVGKFQISDNGGRSFRRSDLSIGIRAKDAVYSGDGRIVALDDQGDIAHTQLVAGISLEETLQDGSYQAGDLIYLNKTGIASHMGESSLPKPAYWQSDEVDLMNRIESQFAPAGQGYLAIELDEQAAMYQTIDRDELRNQLEDNVIRFSGWFNAIGDSVKLQIRILGLSREVSADFDLTSGQWRRYVHSFVIPEAWLQDNEVTFVIELEGSGTVGVDALQLSAAHNIEKAYSDDFVREIGSIAPKIMRFSNVPIGSSAAPFQSWADTVGQAGYVFTQGNWSLYKTAAIAPALDLALDSGSTPWFVIDSAASEGELANLFEYLAAPVSEPYGKLRMEQGRAVPWTETYSRLYIEIADDNGLFTDDRLRSAYVDWVINQISLSPYYNEIKNRLVFVDAMKYSQGLMQSSADYHASSLELNQNVEDVVGLEKLYADYWSNIPRNPDKLAHDWPEILRNISFSGVESSTLAEMLSVMTYDIGGQTGLVIVDQGNNKNQTELLTPELKQQSEAAARILSKGATGRPQKVTRLTDSDQVFVFAAMDDFGTVRVIINNTDDMPATCQLVSGYDLAGSVLHKYDSSGSLIGTEKLRRNESYITVLPGGAVYLEKLDSH